MERAVLHPHVLPQQSFCDLPEFEPSTGISGQVHEVFRE
jgi:hypothetical protein